MSWFTDIAGKAENFLNAMDQSAAMALSTVTPKKVDTDNWNDDISESFTIASQKTGSSSSSISIINSGNGSNGNGNGHRSPSSSRGHTRASSFESIGSNVSKGSLSGHNTKTLLSMTTPSSSSTGADDERLLFEFLNAKNDDPNEDTRLSSISSSSTLSSMRKDDDLTVRDESSESMGSVSMSSSSIDFKGQIRALTTEISSLNRRNIELETECKRLNKRINNFQTHLSSSDATIRELQSRELDLKASLDAKDSQIGVLKIRLQEVNDDLQMKMRMIKDLEIVSETLRTSSESSVSNANESIEEYRQKIHNLESDLIMEREQLKRLQSDTMSQIGHLEDNQKTLIDEIASLQRNVHAEKAINLELNQKLQLSLKRSEEMEKEYADFKLKATRTLQDKDDLLRALKNRESDTDTDEVQRVLQSQCDAMVLEIKDLREKCDNFKRTLDRVQNEDIVSLNLKITQLSEQLESETRLKMELESELKQVMDESRYFQDDLSQTKNNLSQRIADRDAEIDKLRRQLMAKMQSVSGANGAMIDELESRIRNLTDNLIQKQTLVEQLSSEKHSLTLQLERAETRLRDSMSNQKNAEVVIGIHHSPSLSNLVNRAKPLIEENPYDGHVTRRVKRAYGQIDAFSIRLGNFLRAYPSARASVILYIVLLHIWVMFVLFYYEPEVHGPNYKMPTDLTDKL